MNKQKITLVLSLIALISVHSFSQPPARQFFIAIDGLAPAVKFGMEKNISERFSLKGSAGFCLVGPSLLSYNFFGSYKLTKPEKAFGVNLNVGFLDNYIDVISPMFSLGLGGGFGVCYKFRNYSRLTVRAGILTGPSIDNKEFEMLTLPNFGIEYAFACNKHRDKRE